MNKLTFGVVLSHISYIFDYKDCVLFRKHTPLPFSEICRPNLNQGIAFL